MPLQLTSSAFAHGKKIPSKYTCDGENISPPLQFHGIPTQAKSLVLIMVDPDIPLAAKEKFNIEQWDHWSVFNIPPATKGIAEGAKPTGEEGANTRGNNGYGGPCPPDREHRYFFTLYALDTMLSLPPGATRAQIEHAMHGHVVEKTELMGTYVRVAQG
jgi:Raf kinase inhibitor-like YbhB/YbcL family protein